MINVCIKFKKHQSSEQWNTDHLEKPISLSARECLYIFTINNNKKSALLFLCPSYTGSTLGILRKSFSFIYLILHNFIEQFATVYSTSVCQGLAFQVTTSYTWCLLVIGYKFTCKYKVKDFILRRNPQIQRFTFLSPFVARIIWIWGNAIIKKITAHVAFVWWCMSINDRMGRR